MKKPELVVATSNQGKFKEIAGELQGYFSAFYSLKDFKDIPAIEETGGTFLENAEIKAVIVARNTGLFTLGDDSGLVVPSLGGEPGIRSSRYSGEDATDWDNIELLLKKLEPSDDRGAYFVCAFCLASPEGKVLWQGEGTCHGVITQEPRGNGGFGYDPVFLYPPSRKTFAQMSLEEKAQVSHRGMAIKRLKEALEKGIPGLE